MIIFFEGGRLGNQLFQYCGLRKIDSTGPIYIYGMQALKNTLAVSTSLNQMDYLTTLLDALGKKDLSLSLKNIS